MCLPALCKQSRIKVVGKRVVMSVRRDAEEETGFFGGRMINIKVRICRVA